MLKSQKVLKDLKLDQTNLIIDPKKIVGGNDPQVSRTRPLTGIDSGGND